MRLSVSHYTSIYYRMFRVFFLKSGNCSLEAATALRSPLLISLSVVRVLQKSWIILTARSQLSLTTFALLTQSQTSMQSEYSGHILGDFSSHSVLIPKIWNRVQLLATTRDSNVVVVSTTTGCFGFEFLKSFGLVKVKILDELREFFLHLFC